MRMLQYMFLCFIGFSVSTTGTYAQNAADCPDPLFSCLPWGPDGPVPGGPPGPIFHPVAPRLERYVDFNRNFGFIEDDRLILKEGSPDLAPEVSDYLTRHREWIDPNGTYLFPPDAVIGDAALGRGLIIGGGALTQ